MHVSCNTHVFWRCWRTVVFEMDCLVCLSIHPLDASGRTLVARSGKTYYCTVRKHAQPLLATLQRSGLRIGVWSHHTHRRVRSVVRLCFPEIKFAFLRGRRRCVVFGNTYVKPCRSVLVDCNPVQVEYDATRARAFTLRCAQCTNATMQDDELRRLRGFLSRLTAPGRRGAYCRV